MQVKDFIKNVKADSKTFYNLDNNSKDRFRKKYNDLKKHQYKYLSKSFSEKRFNSLLKNKELPYVNKINAIDYLRENIDFGNFFDNLLK